MNVVIDSNIKEFNRLYKDKSNGRSSKDITKSDDKVTSKDLDDNQTHPSPHPPLIYIECDQATSSNRYMKVITPYNRVKKSHTHNNNDVSTPRSLNKL